MVARRPLGSTFDDTWKEAVWPTNDCSFNQVSLPSGERVFFRYADPNVMNAVLPLLDAGQAARMLSQASILIFDSSEAGCTRCVVRPISLPTMIEGDLAFDAAQIESLNARHVQISRLRIMKYLQQAAPEHTANRSDAQLYGDVLQYEASARAIGLNAASTG